MSDCEEHGKMNCKEFSEFILAYLDGELTDAQTETFERHLSLCPNCDHYIETYKLSVECTKTLRDAPPSPPEDVPEELIQAILKSRRA